MIRVFLLTCAVLLALVACGLVFGWGFGVLDNPAWRKDAHGFGWGALACLAASTHPAVAWFDRTYRSPRRNP